MKVAIKPQNQKGPIKSFDTISRIKENKTVLNYFFTLYTFNIYNSFQTIL